MAILTPTSELEAVNTLLANIGESPISSFDDLAVDASIARETLKEISREVQARGWHWNTEKRKLSPNSSKEIILPLNTLRVDSIAESSAINVIERDGKLFNRSDYKNTYEFDGSVFVEIILLHDFSKLPEAARRYITIRAARIFQERQLGAPSISGYNAQDEVRSLAYLRQMENETADRNILTDSYDVIATLQRGVFTRRYY